MKEPKGADKSKAKVKRSMYVPKQPSSSRRTPITPNSNLEEADTTIPLRLTSKTSFRPFRTVSEKISKKWKSRREELSLKKQRNDLFTI